MRSIVISRGKIRACEKIEETSVEATTTMAGIRGRIVGERRKRKKGDERTLDGEGRERALESNCILRYRILDAGRWNREEFTRD